MRNVRFSEQVQPLQRRAELVAVNDNRPWTGRVEPAPAVRQSLVVFYGFATLLTLIGLLVVLSQL